MSNDNQDSTRHGIVASLQKWYEVDEGQAYKLIAEHSDIVEDGIKFRSHNFYVAANIAKAANLTEREGVEEEDEEDDDD